MASSYRIAEKVSEGLYEDERLRSNLTDSEAEIVYKWASDWITAQVDAAADESAANETASRRARAYERCSPRSMPWPSRPAS